MKTNSQFKRIIVVLMATVVALAGLTVGYGLWQDTIDIAVTTTTTVGDFTCFGFAQITTDDPGPPINPAPPNGVKDHTVVSPIYWNTLTYRTFGYTPFGAPVSGEVAKDVGYTNAWGIDNDGLCGAELAQVEVNNGYPSYASITTVNFTNFGDATAVTITAEGINLPAEMTTAGYYLQYYSPAVQGIQHIKSYWLRKLVGPGPNTPDPGEGLGQAADGDGIDNDGDGLIDEDVAVLDLSWENFEGDVVQPGSGTVGALKVHVLQAASQGDEYLFNVWVEVWPS